MDDKSAGRDVKAVIVYESLWGNTATIARAICEGWGAGAVALSTADASPERLAGADLVVAGAPVFAFHLSSERTRDDIRARPEPGAPSPDLNGPSLRAWIVALAPGIVKCAGFDTRVRGPFGKGAPTIVRQLAAKGYRPVAQPEGFLVQGKYGPLRPGEVERARTWGATLRDLTSAEESAGH